MSPLSAAWRELQEETTLTAQSLRLRRQGKPYSFVDDALKREWTIYPFAFDLIPASEGGRGEESITTDWEHEGWGWYDPRSVKDDGTFGGVPNLATSLRRSWFEYDLGDGAGGVLSAGLETLQEDHGSGARVLAGKGLTILTDVMVALEDESQEVWWKNARMAAWHLMKNGRESMSAAVLNVALTCLREVEREVLPRWESLSRSDREQAIRDIARKYGERRLSLNDDISRSFRSFLETAYPSSRPLRILTLSSSSTIARSITDAVRDSPFSFDLRVLESRPLFEGATMAASIAESMAEVNASKGDRNNSVTVYTDASAAIASKDVDLVLLGADMISSNGDTCNKTGSLPAVLSAKHIAPDARAVVVADREKVYPFPPPEHEENDAVEVAGTWSTAKSAAEAERMISEGTKPARGVKNVYFEWVGAELVDNYVLEDGHRTAGDISELAGKVEKTASHFFDGV